MSDPIVRDYRIVGGHTLRVTVHPPDYVHGPRKLTWEAAEGYLTHALQARLAAIPQPWRALNDDYRPHQLDALIRRVVGGDIDEAPDAAHREQMTRLRAGSDARIEATESDHGDRRPERPARIG